MSPVQKVWHEASNECQMVRMILPMRSQGDKLDRDTQHS